MQHSLTHTRTGWTGLLALAWAILFAAQGVQAQDIVTMQLQQGFGKLLSLTGFGCCAIFAGAGLGALVTIQQLSGNFDNTFGGFARLDADGLGFYTGDYRGEGAARQKRIGGPLGMPNRFAQIMVMLIPIALFQIRASTRRLHKLAAAGCCVLILLGGSLGFSRGGAVWIFFF